MYDFDVEAADAANPHGCGWPGHGLDCLCDVDLTLTPEPTGRLMALWCTADDFANHMAWELEKHETVRSLLRNGATPDSLLAIAEEVVNLSGEPGVVGGITAQQQTRRLLVEMLQGGLSVRAVAYLIGDTPEEVVRRVLDSNVAVANLPLYVLLDELIRSGPFGKYSEFCEPTGLPGGVVRNWCHTVGIKRGFDLAKERLVELADSSELTMLEAVKTVNAQYGTTWTRNDGYQVLHRMRAKAAA